MLGHIIVFNLSSSAEPSGGFTDSLFSPQRQTRSLRLHAGENRLIKLPVKDTIIPIVLIQKICPKARGSTYKLKT